ncbi:AraC family transcriptional regulator [Corallococcus coralloides DSM 2259]|uniref:AraC family transcriptional regulator n=1 Tax=Corallococcus coralloides (strain ATCC 25202 / DSM 2259 / NBRC 100086 / M2) TaxID=1144275 RepID=H8MEW2_CORCM|nr:AraC family transcriptional regulator [Corallococcus coralloides]AFE08030.1 AraC family transcriptional regulator [Corallococcus coralloides DSM 2259]
MRKTPKQLAEKPTPLELRDPRGDAVADVLGASLIRHALYNSIEARVPWGLRMPRQNRASFYLVAHGSARLEVEGTRTRVLSTGDVGFVPHGTAHVLRDSADSEPLPVRDGSYSLNGSPLRIGGRGAATTLVAGFFELSDGLGPVLLQGVPPLVVLSASDPASVPGVSAAVQFMLTESASPRPASNIVLQRLADVLFVLALRATVGEGTCQRGAIAAVSDPRIYESLSLMHARVADPWTVDMLARRVGMSRSGFAARFTDLVGASPLQYLARRRIARAAELLRDTTEKVETIAGRVGYESVPAFSRAFKRWQGTGPAAFRKSMQS